MTRWEATIKSLIGSPLEKRRAEIDGVTVVLYAHGREKLTLGCLSHDQARDYATRWLTVEVDEDIRRMLIYKRGVTGVWRHAARLARRAAKAAER